MWKLVEGISCSFTIVIMLLLCSCRSCGSPLTWPSGFHHQSAPSHLSQASGVTAVLGEKTEDGLQVSSSTAVPCVGLISSSCDLQDQTMTCQNGGSCAVNSTSCTLVCQCDQHYTGDRCQHPVTGPTGVDSSLNGTASIQKSSIGSDTQGTVNATGLDDIPCQKPSRTTNGCPLNYPCRHGYCMSDLEGHVSKLECVCDSGWSGHACDECCPLSCGNGSCVQENGTPGCDCFWGYTGQRCEIFDAELYLEDDSGSPGLKVVVAVSVVIVVLLSGATILAIYLMWRHRMPLILKVIDRLQRRSEKYDNTEYIFDAFISYSSCVRNDDNPTTQQTPDDQFVMGVLFPTLEKMGYRVCLHYRDFIPGKAIVDNILDAVQHSKRTLLVISPAFASSEWTRFEYQVAQHEMLKLRHRIVPIIYRDVTGIADLDPNLRYILSSVTYVTWPQSNDTDDVDLFWRSLKHSLPEVPLGGSTSTLSEDRLNNNPKYKLTSILQECECDNQKKVVDEESKNNHSMKDCPLVDLQEKSQVNEHDSEEGIIKRAFEEESKKCVSKQKCGSIAMNKESRNNSSMENLGSRTLLNKLSSEQKINNRLRDEHSGNDESQRGHINLALS